MTDKYNATCAITGKRANLQMYPHRNTKGEMVGWIFLHESLFGDNLLKNIFIDIRTTESDNADRINFAKWLWNSPSVTGLADDKWLYDENEGEEYTLAAMFNIFKNLIDPK